MTDPSPPHDPSAEPAAPHATVYRRRAWIGMLSLVLRTAVAQVVILGGTVVMARHLRPADFGVFAIVQFVLTVISMVGDAGLAGALVQQKAAPTQGQLSSAFFAQLGLASAVFALTWLAAGALRHVWPALPENAPWILRALGVTFVLTSLRTVPTLLLERELLFVRVSLLDTAGSIAFYLTAALLSIAGHGVWALVLGVLAQGLVGVIAAYALRPWRPALGFRADDVRGLLSFGIPYQTRSALVLLTRSVIPVVGGMALGSHEVGLVNWALETAFFPLTFIEILARVSFPLYSRMADAKAELRREIERSVRLGAVISWLLSGLFLGLARPITEVIYSAQWLPAVPLLRLYAVAVVFGMLVFLLAPAFDALGRPGAVVRQMVVVVACVWLAAPIGVSLAGDVGLVAGHLAALVVGAFVIVLLARTHLPDVTIVAPFLAPTAAGLATAALGHGLVAPHVEGPISLTLALVGLGAVFLAVVLGLDRATLSVVLAALPRARRPAVDAAPSAPSPPLPPDAA